MNRSNTLVLPNYPRTLRHSLAAVLLAATSFGASADYQQTLAARGADAFTPPSTQIAINSEEIDNAFSEESMLANPALSDQEVMVDLHARMRAESQLEYAAENLAPELQFSPEQTTEQTTEQTAEQTEAVADASAEPTANQSKQRASEQETAPAGSEPTAAIAAR